MGATGAFAFMGGSSLVSAYASSISQKAQADFAASQAKSNTALSDYQAADAIDRGNLAASGAEKQTTARVGQQRTTSAASGVDINSGSAAAIQGDTAEEGAFNQLMIKNNAWREAWGYKTQAIQSTASGQFAQAAGQNQSQNTLLTGGMNATSFGFRAAGSYYKNNGSTSSGGYGSAGSSNTDYSNYT